MPDPINPSNPAAVSGIDVSRYQTSVDWNTVAGAGIKFVFIKATQGKTLVDPSFTSHWTGAGSAGILRGAYHFFRPDVSPQDQADTFLAVLGGAGNPELAPVLDLELRKLDGTDAWDAVPQAQRTALAVQWLTAVEQGLGRKPIVYLSPSFAAEKLGGAAELAPYPLWIAHYTTRPAPRVPPAWQDWTFWQYTENGTIAGIAGNVDVDLFNGTFESLSIPG